MTSLGFPKQFDLNVSHVIATFLTPKAHKFLDWIDTDKLDWGSLSLWVDDSILFDYKHKFDNYNWLPDLYRNANATYFAETYMESPTNNNCEYLYSMLCENINAIPLLQKLTNNFTTKLNYINWKTLCKNKNAISTLNKVTNNFTTNLDLIHWENLCKNENAVPIIKKFFPELHKKSFHHWTYICENPNCVELLKHVTNNFTEKLYLIDWGTLAENPYSIPLIQQHWENAKEYIYWNSFYLNPNAIPILSNHIDEIKKKHTWISLCLNPNAIPIVKQITNNFTTNITQEFWNYFLLNPNAVPIVEKCIEQKNDNYIDWYCLSRNENAIHLFKNNQSKIKWIQLSLNKSIVELDTKRYQMWLNCMTNFVYNL